jgi:cell wall-associated NlpC family hydrolase
MTDVELKSQLGTEIAGQAKQYARAGVRYQHRGFSRDGCDCTGLIIGCLQELGHMTDYDVPAYSQQWHLHDRDDTRLTDELLKFGYEIPKSESAIGDIAVMRTGRSLAHCGLIVEKDLMVHVNRKNGRCKFAILKNSDWARRWATTVRIDQSKIGNRKSKMSYV